MRTVTVFLPFLMTVLTAYAQTNSPAALKLSPAERSIARARQLIEKKPNDFGAYNALALALSRRARETSDVKYYDEAEAALRQSLATSPDNFGAARIHTWLLLGKHEFPAALEEAKKLNRRMPDDIMTYGFLADANIELGNYKEAEAAAQTMLDLRTGNLPALTRAAYLRELFGDVEGSLELMNMALQSTPPAEVEDAAWILTQMAHLKLTIGKMTDAERYAGNALTLFPHYHYALGVLAKVRIQQAKYDEAIELLEARYKAAPHAENLFDLAEALQLAGRSDQAKQVFAEFEKKSLLETNRKDNSNRELAFYYAEYQHAPVKALEVARGEYAWRRDVFTLDCYAWALHVNGRDKEARKQIESALSVGVRDPKLIRHAAELALATGDKAAAQRYRLQLAEFNTDESPQSRAVIARLSSSH